MDAGRSARDHPPVILGGVTLDVAGRRAVAAGREVRLTATQSALLAHLMGHPGHVCSRAELMTEVWGYPGTTRTRTIDVHVAELRAKLGETLRIRTVRGVGYGVEMPSPST
jgi:two-component system, OmpR family, response regulator MtrA